ncbi:MAG: hypothetical protein EXS31_18760, partial [Pedosphaera sp.]|nr:hypothetical protein [Pedosphaera sp.]
MNPVSFLPSSPGDDAYGGARALVSETDPLQPFSRPHVRGKFLFKGGEKFYVRGVTYGTFRPSASGVEYSSRDTVESDFRSITAHAFNSIRVYTVPPAWFLDLALQHGLSVLIGLPWEQHINFLDDRRCVRGIKEKLREMVARNRSHPAVLGYAVGNEIPSGVVRWHGRRAVERFIESLFAIVRAEDPGALVTYVNYPSTESAILIMAFLLVIPPVCTHQHDRKPAEIRQAVVRNIQNSWMPEVLAPYCFT